MAQNAKTDRHEKHRHAQSEKESQTYDTIFKCY